MTTEKWEERFQKQLLLEGSECTFASTPNVLEITDFIQAELSRSRNEVLEEVLEGLPKSEEAFGRGLAAVADIRAMIEEMKSPS